MIGLVSQPFVCGNKAVSSKLRLLRGPEGRGKVEWVLVYITVEVTRVTLGALPNIRERYDTAEEEYRRQQQEIIDRVYADEK